MSNSTNDIEKGAVSRLDAPHQATIQAIGQRRTAVANPGPLGLMSFASTTLILSLYNVNVRDINTPNVVVGMALGVGGLAQLLAGQWEFVKGNTFGATAFSSYGGFWLSFAAIFIPGTGVGDAYKGAAASQLHNALGIYLITWFIVTFIFLVASLRSSVAFIGLFGFLAITFALLAAGSFMESVMVTKAGGGFGVVTALIAFYIGASDLITKDTAFISLPVLRFQRKD